MSIFVWRDNAGKWALLNTERLSLAEIKYLPVVSMPVKDRMTVPYQGIPTDMIASYSAGDPTRSKAELYSYFTFWNRHTRERAVPEGLFAFLDAAKEEAQRLERALGLAAGEIEIRHSRRIATRFRNTGNLPIRGLRAWYNCYGYWANEWVKLYTDQERKKFPYRIELLDPSEDSWNNFEIGGYELTVRFPERLLVYWNVEYRNAEGELVTQEFYRYFTPDGDGGASWRIPPEEQWKRIVEGATQVGAKDYFNKPFTEYP